MWVETEIDDAMHFAITTARNMMRRNPSLSGQQIIELMLTFIDYEVDLPKSITHDRITHAELYDILYQATRTEKPLRSYLQRITFEYEVELEYLHMFHVNPFRQENEDVSNEPLVFKDVSSQIIHDYNPTSSRIHLTTRDDFARFAQSARLVTHYFPSQLDTWHIPVGTGNDRLYSRLLRAEEQDNSVHSYYKKVYVSIHPIGPRIECRLQSIFQNFALDNVCPLAKFKSHGSIVYKVDKHAISSVPRWIVKKWTDEPMTKMREYIMFKVFYGDFFATVTLFPRLVYHVKFTFRQLQVNDISYVEDRILVHVNHVVAKVRDLAAVVMVANRINVPLLTVDINKHNILDVNVVSIHRTATKMPSIALIQDRFSALGGIFHWIRKHVNKTESPNTLAYRYSRCSEYSPAFDIKVFIAMNLRMMTQRELVDAIVKSFYVGRQQAELLYDSATSNDDNDVLQMRIYTGLNVKIERRNDYEVVCSVKGNRVDARVANHIAYLVRTLLTSSDPDIASARVSNVRAQVNRASVAKGDGGAFDADDFDPNQLLGDDDDAALNKTDVDARYDVGGDTDSEDFDVGEQQNDDATVVPVNAKAEEPSVSPPQVSDKKYILSRLKGADASLFSFETKDNHYKSFASLCASNAKRQPIVITKEQLENNNKMYPGAIPKYVHAGSTKEKWQQNVYICPKIWCSVSQVAMTPEQFKKLGGCPSKDDRVMHLYRPGEEHKSKFISFLDPSKHPNELCVPCCFFIDHGNKVAGKLRKRFGKCSAFGAQNESNAPDATAAERPGDAYVKGLEFPLEVGRYGRIPYSLAQFLGCGECHKRVKDGPCFVRRGISHNSQYFLSCMADVLHIPGVTTAADLVNHVAANLAPHDYAMLNGGNLMRVFVDHEVDAFDLENYSEFREWFVRHADYHTAFNLQHGGNNKPARIDVRREFMVYVSIHNFINFLRSDVVKDHTTMLEFAGLQWINPNNINVVLIEDDGVDTVFVMCPSRAPINTAAATTKHALVLKYGKFYEPLCQVHFEEGGLHERREFALGHDARVDRVVQLQEKTCQGVVMDPMHEAILAHVMSRQPALYVLASNFKARWVITQSGTYIPTPFEFPPPRGASYVHASRVDKHVASGSGDMSEALHIFHEIGAVADDENQFYAQAAAHEDGIGITMGDGSTYVPVVSGDHAEHMHAYMTDAYIFADEHLPNPSYDYVEQWNMRQAAVQGLRRTITMSVMTDASMKREFDFLRFEGNPFPLDMRVQFMKRLMDRASPAPITISPIEHEKLAHAMLSHDVAVLTDVLYRPHQDVVFLTQGQVQQGELEALLQNNATAKYMPPVKNAIDDNLHVLTDEMAGGS